MVKTFVNEWGVFTMDVARDPKIASWLMRGTYQQESIELLLRYVTPESIVVDIGAHVGLLTVPLARHAQTVHAFEPLSFEALCSNVRANALTNVICYHTALGSIAGHIGMQEGRDAASAVVQSRGNIPLETLDSFNLNPDVIKIDVEGYGPEVLKGARATIERYRPVIYMEVNLPALRKQGWFPLLRLGWLLRHYDIILDGVKTSLIVACMKIEPKFFFTGWGGTTFDVLCLPKNPKRTTD